MDNSHDSAGRKQDSEVENINEFDILQRQLDEFIEKENTVNDVVGHDEHGPESQHRLDEFVDDLQQQMDTFIKQSQQQKTVKAAVNPPKQSKTVAKPTPAKKSGKSVKKQKPAVQQKAVETGSSSANPTKTGNLNLRFLTAGGLIFAAVIWIVWPSSTEILPEPPLVDQEIMAETMPEVVDPPAVEPIEPVEVREKQLAAVSPKTVKVSKPENDIDKVMKPAKQKATVVTTAAVTPVAAAKIPAETVNNSTLTVTATIGNIRREPNAKADVMHRLKQGIKVFAIKREGDWVQVRIKGRLAWGHHSVFAMNSEPNSKEIAKPQADGKKPVPAVKPASVAETVINKIMTVNSILGNVRSEPETSAPVVFRLKQGTKVFALKGEGDWVQVRIKDAVAWAHHSIF